MTELINPGQRDANLEQLASTVHKLSTETERGARKAGKKEQGRNMKQLKGP